MAKNYELLSFLKSTAINYDMDLNQVKRVYHKHNGNHERFYSELEKILHERKQNNMNSTVNNIIKSIWKVKKQLNDKQKQDLIKKIDKILNSRESQ